MDGATLGRLRMFVAVAERRSFSAAARAMGISPSAASQAVTRLESELGCALLVRTTRSVALTDAGTRLLGEAAPALASAEQALLGMKTRRSEPAGLLRLNVPRIACQLGLPRLLAEYTRRHPEMRVEVVVDDRRVDVVRDGFDAGVRSRTSVQKDMVRVPMTGPARLVVVGAKRYFSNRKRPKHPRDLIDHVCLGWRSLQGGAEYQWEFSEQGRALSVAVDGPVVSNDTALLIACATAGLGLAFVVEAEVRRELASKQLEIVLGEFAIEVPGLFVYFPRAARQVPKLRAWLDCVRTLYTECNARPAVRGAAATR
ncbi:MAG: LysR family transcriptional regulator [Myxococcales bacterium]